MCPSRTGLRAAAATGAGIRQRFRTAAASVGRGEWVSVRARPRVNGTRSERGREQSIKGRRSGSGIPERPAAVLLRSAMLHAPGTLCATSAPRARAAPPPAAPTARARRPTRSPTWPPPAAPAILPASGTPYRAPSPARAGVRGGAPRASRAQWAAQHVPSASRARARRQIFRSPKPLRRKRCAPQFRLAIRSPRRAWAPPAERRAQDRTELRNPHAGANAIPMCNANILTLVHAGAPAQRTRGPSLRAPR